MPEGQTNVKLAEEFATFSLEKIKNICDKFMGIEEFKPSTNEQVPVLRKFSPLSCSEVHKEILSMGNKTCELDHILTKVIKGILPTILGTITEIVNLSLSTGSFAQDWKIAIVLLLLKKPELGLTKKNYRPVSNLSFLSKLVEQCMFKQLLQHCKENHWKKRL